MNAPFQASDAPEDAVEMTHFREQVANGEHSTPLTISPISTTPIPLDGHARPPLHRGLSPPTDVHSMSFHNNNSNLSPNSANPEPQSQNLQSSPRLGAAPSQHRMSLVGLQALGSFHKRASMAQEENVGDGEPSNDKPHQHHHHTHERILQGVDMVHGTVDKRAVDENVNEDAQSDKSTESGGDVLVGGDDDDDDEDATVLPWFVPKNFVLALPNADNRMFKLTKLQRLFVMMTDTQSCYLASWYGRIMMCIICLGVLSIIISSTAPYQTQPSSCSNPACNNNATLCPDEMICAPEPINAFYAIDEFVVIFFTIDFMTRLLLIGHIPERLNTLIEEDWDEQEERNARQKNRRVIKDPKMTSVEAMCGLVFSFEGAIDIVSIIPFYVLLATGSSGGSTGFIRVCRIFRIFKVIKSYSGIITVFKRTFYQSREALVVMALVVLVTQILFSCILFAFEAGTYTVNAEHPDGAWLRKIAGTSDYSESPFDSIPTTMYWAIITLTTVGYGDLTPVTSAGRAVASLAAVCGIFCIALPVTVIGSNFSREFEAYQVRQKINKRSRRKMKIHLARLQFEELKSLKVLMSGVTATDQDYSINDDGEIQLTELQKKDIQRAFDIFDVDGSLTMSYNEMGIAMNAWGYDVTVRELHDMLVSAEKNTSGQISLPEFERIVLKLLRVKLANQGIRDFTPEEMERESFKQKLAQHNPQLGRNGSGGLLHGHKGHGHGGRHHHEETDNAYGDDFRHVPDGNESDKDSETHSNTLHNSQYNLIETKEGGARRSTTPSPATVGFKPSQESQAQQQLQQDNATNSSTHSIGFGMSATTAAAASAVANSNTVNYVTIDSCSHSDLLKYANRLIAANIALSTSMQSMNQVLTQGPSQ